MGDRGQLFGVFENHAHRLAAFLGQDIADRRFDYGSLAAEIAADWENVNLDFRRIEAEIAGEAVTQGKGRFIRGPDFHLAVVMNLYRAGMGFDVAMKSERRPKRVLENPRRFLKPRFEIAVGPLAVGLYVGKLRVPFRGVFVTGGIIMQHQRAGTNRLNRIGDERQWFVLNVDQI